MQRGNVDSAQSHFQTTSCSNVGGVLQQQTAGWYQVFNLKSHVRNQKRKGKITEEEPLVDP